MHPKSGLAGVVHHLRRRYGGPTGDGELLARFVHERDESAFADLVRRHGGLVLGVARRQLADRQLADDVFQGTFLALARQSGRLGQPASLVNWLYTVALRLTQKAKVQAARRTALNRQLLPPPPPHDPLAEVTGRELVGIIDEELSRLPEDYRLPLLLCALEGLSREEAARRLGWTTGMVKGRLERGRELLRKRLTARGLTVPAALVGVLVADTVRAVPPALTAATSRAALAALTAPAAAVSLKALLAGTVVLVALGVGVGAASRERERPEAAQPPVAHAPDSPKTPQPAPRVDAEGVPLPAGVLTRIGSSRFRHADGAYDVAVAPDGRSVASLGCEGIRVWEVATGKLVCAIPLPGSFVGSRIAFSADGRDLLCVTEASEDLAFLRFDAATGRERLRLELKNEMRLGSAIAPSGRCFAYTRSDKSIHICDTVTGRELRSFAGLGTSVAFSPDERILATADHSDTIALFDAATGFKAGEFKHENGQFTTAEFAPDGCTLAAVSMGQGTLREVYVWDVGTRQYRGQVKGRGADSAYAFQFSRDGKSLATFSPFVEPVIWDSATLKEIRRFPGVFSAICGAFSPNDKTLIVGTSRGSIVLADCESGRFLPVSANPLVGVESVRFSDDGRELICRADRLAAWDPSTGREVMRYPSVLTRFGAPVLSPDRRLLAGVGDDRVLRTCDAATGREVCQMSGEERVLSDKFTFTPDGRRLIAGNEQQQLVIWDNATGRKLGKLLGHDGWVAALVVSQDGRRLASVSDGGIIDSAVYIWDLATYKAVRHFSPHRGEIMAAAFSPDGRWLATAGGIREQRPRVAPDGTGDVQLWDVDTGRELRSFSGHTDMILQVVFSADGRMLATGGYDTTVRLWEVATGGERQCFIGHGGSIASLAFAPDGRTLAASSYDAPVYIWDVFGRLEQPALPPTATDLTQAWDALAGTDSKAAFQAIRRLVGAPGSAVALLRERLKPAAAADRERVRELIRRLENVRFAERQQALTELQRLGDAASAQFRAALPGEASAQVRQSLQWLIDKIEAGTPETLRARRAVEVLEHIGTPAAREHLRLLAGGAIGAVLTEAAAHALKRLER